MNIFKILSINILITLFLLLILELIASFISIDFFSKYYNATYKTTTAKDHINRLYYKNENDINFREDRNTDSKKPSILIMGCSFAYGFGLHKKDVVSYRMSELINNPIYNRAYNGWGIKQVLYLLENNYVFNEINEPKYIIYFFISDHIARIQGHKFHPFDRELVPFYTEKDGKLIEQKSNILNKFIFPEYLSWRKGKKDEKDYNIEKTIVYFNEIQKTIKRKWKNTKFVIAIYPMYYDNKEKIKNWTELLNKNEFIVIDISKIVNEDLTSKKYKLDDFYHPSPEAWDVILPPLLRELKLI